MVLRTDKILWSNILENWIIKITFTFTQISIQELSKTKYFKNANISNPKIINRERVYCIEGMSIRYLRYNNYSGLCFQYSWMRYLIDGMFACLFLVTCLINCNQCPMNSFQNHNLISNIQYIGESLTTNT